MRYFVFLFYLVSFFFSVPFTKTIHKTFQYLFNVSKVTTRRIIYDLKSLFKNLGACFYPFWPLAFPLMSPKQGKFGWYIKSCHGRILPTYNVTYAPKITFILWFIGGWARFYPFWPPVKPTLCPRNKVNVGDISKVVTCASYPLLMWHIPQK